jgi:protein-disulfide isomerase
MRKNLWISLGMVALVAVVIAVVARAGDDAPTDLTADGAGADRLVRPDSQRLNEADGSDTFVEFLDFECEACRAAHPAIEQLREEYGGRVTFVVRYMPLHNNSERASRAAEAAADQGKFEAMYDRLFETQPQWGEKSTSQEDVFFDLAEELDLDMDRFREVYDDRATIERVQRDKADGKVLGVTGTPTFFLNGEKLEVSGIDDLVTALDDAVAS